MNSISGTGAPHPDADATPLRTSVISEAQATRSWSQCVVMREIEPMFKKIQPSIDGDTYSLNRSRYMGPSSTVDFPVVSRSRPETPKVKSEGEASIEGTSPVDTMSTFGGVGKTEIDTMMLYVQAQVNSSHQFPEPEPQMPTSSLSAPPTSETESPSQSQIERTTIPGKRTRLRVAKYVCSFEGCNKTFRQRAHLQTHLRTHTGEKPYVCPFDGCTRLFSQRCNLRTHIRSHTGERPFVCPICGKAFSQQGNMRNHQLIHSNERPLKCILDGCHRAFNQLGNLKAHQNVAHKATVSAFMEKLKQGASRDDLVPEDREVFDYFCGLYRNSNRGIKGRGKGTRTITTSTTVSALHFEPPRGEDHPSQQGAVPMGPVTKAESIAALRSKEESATHPQDLSLPLYGMYRRMHQRLPTNRNHAIPGVFFSLQPRGPPAVPPIPILPQPHSSPRKSIRDMGGSGQEPWDNAVAGSHTFASPRVYATQSHEMEPYGQTFFAVPPPETQETGEAPSTFSAHQWPTFVGGQLF